MKKAKVSYQTLPKNDLYALIIAKQESKHTLLHYVKEP